MLLASVRVLKRGVQMNRIVSCHVLPTPHTNSACLTVWLVIRMMIDFFSVNLALSVWLQNLKQKGFNRKEVFTIFFTGNQMRSFLLQLFPVKGSSCNIYVLWACNDISRLIKWNTTIIFFGFPPKKKFSAFGAAVICQPYHAAFYVCRFLRVFFSR